VTRVGKAAQFLKLGGLVQRLEPPGLGILEHPSPKGLGLTHANSIGVCLCFLEMPIHVRAAQQDLAPAPTEFPSQVAGAIQARRTSAWAAEPALPAIAGSRCVSQTTRDGRCFPYRPK